MALNKCTLLRLGNRNSVPDARTCHLNGIPLQETEIQKDLGIWMTDNLKPSTQCCKAAKTATSMLYFIKQAFTVFDEDCSSKIFAPEIYEVLKKYDSEWLVPFGNACKNSILGEDTADTHTDTADEDNVLELDATNSDAAMPDTIMVPAKAPKQNLERGDPPLVLPATVIDKTCEVEHAETHKQESQAAGCAEGFYFEGSCI
ncbi:unnamed protein product [Dibothriocephalus latus]|uniref:Uncharacterized protein n=1 Tax=Dibothriocephalus latus TaxID=60516 RepID=A0A3P7MY61_DIBLA|nr:unnamed protein product [Dibothriocephalus latus]